ncbi:MAG: DUF6161 domain-containing protein [Methylovirgula sp.]|nr:DUF6161 domain-containing protein [Methylovirgula sp.]
MTDDETPKVPEPYLVVDIQGHAPLRFESFEELAKWFNNEKTQWAWLTNSNQASSGEIESLRQAYVNGISRIDQALSALRNKDNPNIKNQLANELTNFYRGGSGYLSSDPRASLAKQKAAQFSRDAGAAFFLTQLGRTVGITNGGAARGVIDAILDSYGITPNSPQAVNEAINQITSAHQQEEQSQRNAWDSFVREAEQTVANVLKNGNDKLSSIDDKLALFTEQHRVTNDNFTREANAVIDSIQATEKTYKEQMSLQAPVEYWSKEVTRHRGAERVFSCIGIIYAAVVISLIVGTLILGVPQLAHEKGLKDDPYPYLASATGAVLLVTIAFWIGRILSRLFMSARHLAIDAGERVTLIQTYLALTEGGTVAESERSLVLAPIFRSSSDGIVKDEGGAPDLSLASTLAKFLDKR